MLLLYFAGTLRGAAFLYLVDQLAHLEKAGVFCELDLLDSLTLVKRAQVMRELSPISH